MEKKAGGGGGAVTTSKALFTEREAGVYMPHILFLRNEQPPLPHTIDILACLPARKRGFKFSHFVLVSCIVLEEPATIQYLSYTTHATTDECTQPMLIATQSRIMVPVTHISGIGSFYFHVRFWRVLVTISYTINEGKRKSNFLAQDIISKNGHGAEKGLFYVWKNMRASQPSELPHTVRENRVETFN